MFEQCSMNALADKIRLLLSNPEVERSQNKAG